MSRTTKQQLYRWWLYRGPGFRKLRRLVRQGEEILPPGFDARDSTFTGENAIEAAHEVERLRSMTPPIDYTVREFPRGEILGVSVEPVRNLETMPPHPRVANL